MNLSENSGAAPEESPKNPLDVLHTASADVVHTETLPESAEWERIRSMGKFAADTIKQGRAANVPEVLIYRYAYEIIMQYIEREDYGFVVRFLKSMNLGSSDVQLYLEELASKQQKGIAEKEQQRQLKKTAKPRMRQRHYLVLSPDATIADLVQELASDKVAGDVSDLLFSELADNLSTDLGPKLIALMNTREATKTKLTDFFGCDLDHLATYLPIKFRKTTSGNLTQKKPAIQGEERSRETSSVPAPLPAKDSTHRILQNPP